MSTFSVTREGQELGSFELPQIKEGLKTGFFLLSDWGWREGMTGWQGLGEIVGPSAQADTPRPSKADAVPATSPAVRKLPPPKSENFNPYAAPAASSRNAPAHAVLSSGGTVPFDVIQALVAARPWMKFISVLMGLFCVAFILSGLGNLSSSGGILVAPIQWLIAVCSNYPALKLSKSGKAIARLSETRSFDDLQVVIEEQRRFWKSFGIASIIGPALLIVFGILVTGGFR